MRVKLRSGPRQAALLLGMLALAPAHAADPPPAAAKPGAQVVVPLSVPPVEGPAAPVFAPGTGPLIMTNPGAALTTMADTLDRQGNIVVMEVEGRPITQGDIADSIRALPFSMGSLPFETLYNRSLQQLIRHEAMFTGAEKLGLDKDPFVRRRAKMAYERVVAEEWLNRSANTGITDDALRARYEHDFVGKPGPLEVRARAILVQDETEARLVVELAQGGRDFAELARQHSKDASAASGGDLGYVRLEALGPEVGSVIFALTPGQIAAYPVRAQVGYFILRAEGRRQGATPTFEQARGDLQRTMRREAALAAVEARLGAVTSKQYKVGEKRLPMDQGGAIKGADK